MIKSIETVYNGYRFRSRLEARWAVFFDTLGIQYYYELEGFDLGEFGYYLPDFKLSFPYTVWVEVKGNDPTIIEIDKAAHLCLMLKQQVIILSGMIGTNEENIAYHFSYHEHTDGGMPGGEVALDWIDDDGYAYPSIPVYGGPGWFGIGRKDCRELWVCAEGSAHCLNPITGDERWPVHPGYAYTAARQARFEHGQIGAPANW